MKGSVLPHAALSAKAFVYFVKQVLPTHQPLPSLKLTVACTVLKK